MSIFRKPKTLFAEIFLLLPLLSNLFLVYFIYQNNINGVYAISLISIVLSVIRTFSYIGFTDQEYKKKVEIMLIIIYIFSLIISCFLVFISHVEPFIGIPIILLQIVYLYTTKRDLSGVQKNEN